MEMLHVLLVVDVPLATKLMEIVLLALLVRNLSTISAQIVQLIHFRLMEQEIVNNVRVVQLVTTLTVTV